MSAMPPLTAKEIIDIVMKAMEQKGDLHARIHVSRGTTVVPGQSVKEEFFNTKVEVDVPADQPKIIDAVHKVKADLEVLVGEFKAAHMPKTSNMSNAPNVPNAPNTPSTSSAPVQWMPTKSPNVEMLPANAPGAAPFLEFAKQHKEGYWLNQDQSLIFRKKGATEK